jgi:hypothetical protein
MESALAITGHRRGAAVPASQTLRCSQCVVLTSYCAFKNWSLTSIIWFCFVRVMFECNDVDVLGIDPKRISSSMQGLLVWLCLQCYIDESWAYDNFMVGVEAINTS